jgi:hypothetical protein
VVEVVGIMVRALRRVTGRSGVSIDRSRAPWPFAALPASEYVLNNFKHIKLV